MKKGLIHVYSGTGKGKTTSAVGLAIRALGAGLKVCYCSFHKNVEKYGYHEVGILQKNGAKILTFTQGHPHLNKSLDEQVICYEVNDAMVYLTGMLKTEAPDLLVLDEILISVRDKYLEEQVLIDFMLKKPEQMELVLTGRGASAAVIDIADYVSEINKIKHPFDTGVKSRKGIEF